MQTRRVFFLKCLIFALPKGVLAGILVIWSQEAVSRTVGRRESGEAAFESSPQDASEEPK